MDDQIRKRAKDDYDKFKKSAEPCTNTWRIEGEELSEHLQEVKEAQQQGAKF